MKPFDAFLRAHANNLAESKRTPGGTFYEIVSQQDVPLSNVDSISWYHGGRWCSVSLGDDALSFDNSTDLTVFLTNGKAVSYPTSRAKKFSETWEPLRNTVFPD